MKRTFTLTLTLTLIVLSIATIFATTSTAGAQTRIGTVDMNKAFTSYYKTKDAEAKLDASRNQATTDLDARTAALRVNMEAITKLEAEAKDPSKRAAAVKQRDEILGKVRELDREVVEFRQNRERQLQEQFLRMRGDLVQEITKVVEAQAKAAGYDLVLDSSTLGISQVKSVIYSSPTVDFTDSVIAELNRTTSAR
jgi:outer membrane protein